MRPIRASADFARERVRPIDRRIDEADEFDAGIGPVPVQMPSPHLAASNYADSNFADSPLAGVAAAAIFGAGASDGRAADAVVA